MFLDEKEVVFEFHESVFFFASVEVLSILRFPPDEFFHDDFIRHLNASGFVLIE